MLIGSSNNKQVKGVQRNTGDASECAENVLKLINTSGCSGKKFTKKRTKSKMQPSKYLHHLRLIRLSNYQLQLQSNGCCLCCRWTPRTLMAFSFGYIKSNYFKSTLTCFVTLQVFKRSCVFLESLGYACCYGAPLVLLHKLVRISVVFNITTKTNHELSACFIFW